ncbi:MAG: C4-dicarboxylate ABC transporter substrate-binding protein, partial [Bacillota bacterium]
MRRQKFLWLVLALFVAAVLVAGCGGGDKPQSGKPAEQAKTKDLNVATGTTSGVYYVLGNGMA